MLLEPTVPINLIGILMVKPIVDPLAFSVVTSTSNSMILPVDDVDLAIRSNPDHIIS